MFPNVLFAVHISDGILAPAWWLTGIGLTVLLALVGAWRIRDDEIPRIALLTSAFFVASLIHVRVGPTSAHLLLNGLMGVILGWRAALAIPIAVLLQYVLFVHGGYTTIGINSLVMTLPALLASSLFGLLRRMPWIRLLRFQVILTGASSLVFILSSVFSVTLLIHQSSSAALELAKDCTFHPLTMSIAGLVSLLAIWAERKLGNAAEFPLGLLVGEVIVLATVALNCVVILAGRQKQLELTLPVLILLVAHLPIAIVEGIIVGFTVGFLARVRPDILGMPEKKLTIDNCQLAIENCPQKSAEAQFAIANCQLSIVNYSNDKRKANPLPPALLLAALAWFGLTAPAQAHRLEGEYKILPSQKIRIESWFNETGLSPDGATVEVFRKNGDVLVKGTLDKNGVFIFTYSQAEPLVVVISTEGHRKELTVPLSELDRSLTASTIMAQDPPAADRSNRITIKDVLIGIGFVLALAAFLLSWRNARRLRQLRVMLSPPEISPPDPPPTDPNRR